jgi:hypothetical protein
MLERPLPYAPESERVIIGAVILDNDLMPQAVELLRGIEMSYAHNLIWCAMLVLSKQGSEINPILIGEELRREGWLERVGGFSFLSELTYGLPRITNLVHYVKIVAEKAGLRQLARVGNDLVQRTLEPDAEPAALAGWAVRQFAEVVRPDSAAVRVVVMADVEPETVRWLWHPYIALGKFTIIEGDPGLGKSWLTCALAAAVSRGFGLPGVERFVPANVLMLSAEDGLGDTLRPRLDAVGADVSRVLALAEPLTFDTAGLLRLEVLIIERSPILVIIDPLFAFTGGKVDIHRANECRAISAPLAAIAERCGCALLAVRHLGKARGGGHVLNAGIGSIDFSAAARSVLLVGQDPDVPTKRAIVQIKNNLAPLGPALGYKLEDSQFWWTGTSDLTAGRMLSAIADEETKGAQAEAVDFLRQALADGARLAKEIKAEAAQAGLTEQMLRTARQRLGVQVKKEGRPGSHYQRWVWFLPSPEDVAECAEDVSNDDNQHLRASDVAKDTYSQHLAEDVAAPVLQHLRPVTATSSADERRLAGNLPQWTHPDGDPLERM